MKKFIYNKNKIKIITITDKHGDYIKNNAYDYTIRGVIFNKNKAYIRINDLSVYSGIKYKKINHLFNNNLNSCIKTLKKSGYNKIYTSYDFNKLSYADKLTIKNL